MIIAFRLLQGLLCIGGLSLILFCMATGQNMDLPILMQFALMGCFYYGLYSAIMGEKAVI